MNKKLANLHTTILSLSKCVCAGERERERDLGKALSREIVRALRGKS